MNSLIHLQAAMGLGILLFELAKIVLFVLFPTVCILIISKKLSALKKNGQAIGRRELAFTILNGLVAGLTAILAVAVMVVFYVYFFVDLSIS